MTHTIRCIWSVVVGMGVGLGGLSTAQGQFPKAAAEQFVWTPAFCEAYVRGFWDQVAPCELDTSTAVYRSCRGHIAMATAQPQQVSWTVDPGGPPTLMVTRHTFAGHVPHAVARSGTYTGSLKLTSTVLSTYWPQSPAPRRWQAAPFLQMPEACNGRDCTTPEQTLPTVDKAAFVVSWVLERFLTGPPEIDINDTTTPREAFVAVRCVNSGCVQIGPCAGAGWQGLWLALPLLLVVGRRRAVLVCALVLLPTLAHAKPHVRFKVLDHQRTWAEIGEDHQAAKLDKPSRGYRDVEAGDVLAKGKRRADGVCEVPAHSIISPFTHSLLINHATCELILEGINVPPEPPDDGGTGQGLVYGCRRHLQASKQTMLVNPITPTLLENVYQPRNSITDAFISFLHFNEALWVLDNTYNHSVFTDLGDPPTPETPFDCNVWGGGGAGSDLQQAVTGWQRFYSTHIYDETGLNNLPGLPGGDCLQYQDEGFGSVGSVYVPQSGNLFHEHAIACFQHEQGFYLCEFSASGSNGVGSATYMGGNVSFLGITLPVNTRVLDALTVEHYNVIIDIGGVQTVTYCPPAWQYTPIAWTQ